MTTYLRKYISRQQLATLWAGGYLLAFFISRHGAMAVVSKQASKGDLSRGNWTITATQRRKSTSSITNKSRPLRPDYPITILGAVKQMEALHD